MSVSRISDLAAEVSRSTAILDEHLSKNDLPQPSFDPDAPIDAFGGAPDHIESARNNAIEACIELQQLLGGNVNVMIPDVRAILLHAPSNGD